MIYNKPVICITDLETLSLSTSAAVIQIGAVKIDVDFNILGTFSMTIDPQDAAAHGSTSQSTLDFWNSSSVSPEAKRRAFGGRNTSKDVAEVFSGFLDNVDYVLGNGTAADNVWLRNYYHSLGIKQPDALFHRNDLCLKTLRNLCHIYKGKEDNELYPSLEEVDEYLYERGIDHKSEKHDALSDCFIELLVLKNCLRTLKVSAPLLKGLYRRGGKLW